MKNTLLVAVILLSAGCAGIPEKGPAGDDQPLIQLSSAIQGQWTPPENSEPGFEDISLSSQRRLQVLTNKMAVEKETRNYMNNGQADVITQPDGTILYPYGLAQANLIAQRMMYSKIILQEGEKIMSAAAGDTTRWNILPNYIGNASSYTPVVLVKPLVGGLQTSLSIITDKRDYDISMKSVDSGDYTVRIGFYYPQDMADAIRVGLPQDKIENKNSRQPRINIENIKYDYRIKGNPRLRWYPTKVFDDGRKVFIRMPDQIDRWQLPVFMAIDRRGEMEMVNYRYYKPYFIVDTIFDRGILMLGTDRYRQTVQLTRV
ncbi:MAG: TrbG/VirB9 family P-type conjugative transfer protein [Candidatus Omnitrophica bacterium]|nr:TrbG/VirB9 family P-type conjugative transfer protein [Candidatus Omnitrophota bacterium]